MKKNAILKTVGGLSIMLSVFLLLAIASNFNMAVDGARLAMGDKEEYQGTSLVQNDRTLPPKNVVEGFFEIDRDGDYTTTGNKNGTQITHHYRSIHSDRIKTADESPVLKLQVHNNDKKSWKTTKINKIDKENGKVYFLLKTQEGDSIVPNDYYTGTYQLIFK